MTVASPSSSQTLDLNPEKPEQPAPSPLLQDPAPSLASAPAPENPNPSHTPALAPSPVIPPPPAAPSFTPAFRSLAGPQYSAYPNPGYPPPLMAQNPGIQPPGVAAPMRPGPMYPVPLGQARVAYAPASNGYMAVPPSAPLPPGAIPPPGMPRYPPSYPMLRPGFPPRPGMVSPIVRPPIPGIRGAPPIVTPVLRPPIAIAAPPEKPQTTVYVGKIASTVDNDFLLSLLRLCGPVKSWKRAQDPTDGTPKGFGFCEFESAEGILRALRLLSKLSIDGQELVLNINQATREYLERYVEKKTETEKLKDAGAESATREDKSVAEVENQDLQKPVTEETKEDTDDYGDKENQDSTHKFGIVTDEDRDADKEALEKLTDMIEERLKTQSLPPPPARLPADGSARSVSDVPSKSRDGDSDVDITKGADNKNDDEMTSEVKLSSEGDKLENSSADKGGRHDLRIRERDRERDLKRNKERELERHERERERERVRRERDRDMKSKETERLYAERLKEWEAREREKERQRKLEKEREKDREWERRKLILKQEDESDDEEIRRRRRRSSAFEEKKRKRRREREEDLADRSNEEEEIAEAKKRALEAQEKDKESKALPVQMSNVTLSDVMQVNESTVHSTEHAEDCGNVTDVGEGIHIGDENHEHVSGDEQMGSAAESDIKQSTLAPTRKLGFGLVGSGKRTAVPSVFHVEDDENVDEKKMRPLVPIDYSADELQAVQATISATPPNLAAAAEFAKRISSARISSANHKEEKSDSDKERNRRTSDRTSHRDRDRFDDENTRLRDESKEKVQRTYDLERNHEDKLKAENKKLLDAKQLIDMIPKTKEELFTYEINWEVYDKHKLHERMRPWISKKIAEFLGEEEDTLVDYILSNTKEHAQASKMLELLQAILDDEAEMFVLKMWRMLIFEIKKVETGLAGKPRS